MSLEDQALALLKTAVELSEPIGKIIRSALAGHVSDTDTEALLADKIRQQLPERSETRAALDEDPK